MRACLFNVCEVAWFGAGRRENLQPPWESLVRNTPILVCRRNVRQKSGVLGLSQLKGAQLIVSDGYNSFKREIRLIMPATLVQKDEVLVEQCENINHCLMSNQTASCVANVCVCVWVCVWTEPTPTSRIDDTNSSRLNVLFPFLNAVSKPISILQLMKLLTMRWETTTSSSLKPLGSGTGPYQVLWLVRARGVARGAKILIESITVFLRRVFVHVHVCVLIQESRLISLKQKAPCLLSLGRTQRGG